MSIPSLQSMCMAKIINNIKQMPPVLMEELLGCTKEVIIKDVEKKIWKDIKECLPHVIDEIVMNKVSEINGLKEKDLGEYIKNINPNIINIASESADSIMTKLEPILCDRYLQHINNRGDYSDYSDDSD